MDNCVTIFKVCTAGEAIKIFISIHEIKPTKDVMILRYAVDAIIVTFETYLTSKLQVCRWQDFRSIEILEDKCDLLGWFIYTHPLCQGSEYIS